MTSSFVFLRSYYESLGELSNKKRLELLDAILGYVFEGRYPEELSSSNKALFYSIRPTIDNSIRRYEASVANGRRGGRPTLAASSENLKKPEHETG